MDDQDYQVLMEKLGSVTNQNKQLRRANLNKDKTIRHLRRVIKKLKDEAANERKQHYKNGRRGPKFNG
jgi:ABC-type Fe2+-enterobactin transport system substrate-binding protein